MSSIWDTPFVVVDVETSGSNSEKNRVIDIACLTVQGGEIISEYTSLVNPHQFIPPFISEMTGIRNELVFNAPEPEEVFPQVLELLKQEGAVFVAHNVNFDWSFVESSLKLVSLSAPKIERLCTIKLSRRIIPSSIKKNLGAVTKYFGIHIKNRHRAYGDTFATAKLLIELLEQAEQQFNISTTEELLQFQNTPRKKYPIPARIQKTADEIIQNAPNEPGVYYFLDQNDNILYIGKSKSLHDRLHTYFHTDTFHSKKIAIMLKQFAKIKWEVTATELAALILESKEIKRYKPPFNIIDKMYKDYPFIAISKDVPFPKFTITNNIEGNNIEYFGPFRSYLLAKNILSIIEKEFKIRKCDKNITEKQNNKPCLYYYIDKCDSPCSGNITQEQYMEIVESCCKFLSGFTNGIINQLEELMLDSADNLEYEKADIIKDNIFELKRILERQDNVSTSINKNNLIIILPASIRDKTLEVFYIKSGKLVFQYLIGRKAPLNNLFDLINKFYFNGSVQALEFTPEDINELRIISSWIHRQYNNGKFIYIEQKSENQVKNQLEKAIREFEFAEENAETSFE